MSSKMVCNQCGCTDIDTDPARGDAVCTNCGSVLEDQIIVSEIQFEEHATGASSVIGQFVSSDGTKSHSLGISFPHGMKKESRTVTLDNGRKRIQHLGSQLKLNQHCLDTAFNFFKMAIHKNLTRGRKTAHVTSACVYIVCRTEGTPHFLLDISDILQINVYTLGKTYLHLSRALCINIPAIDPCLYIARFAHKLEFGEKTHEVSMTAMRLVSRMKRDWMHTGRRPSGLCGAALIVAARMHEFSRSVQDLVQIVKVCDTTIRKRLMEFSCTASSQLTIEEFQTIDLEEEADPPAFTAGKIKAQKAKLAHLEEQNKLPEIEDTVTKLQNEIEQKLQPPKPKGIMAAYAKMSDSSESSTSRSKSPTDEVCKFLEEEALRPFFEENETASPSKLTQTVEEGHEVPVEQKVCVEKAGQDLKPSHVALGIKDMVKEVIKEDTQSKEENEDGVLDLTGIDDAELDKFLLNEDEVKWKTDLWMTANADYLQAQKEKEERLLKEREEEEKNPEKKKPKRNRKKKQPIQAATAEEAIVKLLQEKKISNKINYEVLNDLKGRGSTPVSAPIKEPPFLMGGDSKNASLNRLRKASVSIDLTKSEEKPDAKRIKIEESFTPAVVVESGPVQYIGEGKDELEEEEEELSDEEEHIHASQLFGRNPEDEDHEIYEDD